MKKNILIFILLATGHSIFSERIDSPSKSPSFFDKAIRKASGFLDLRLKSYKDAPELYQDLCKQAYEAFEIGHEVKIKTMPANSNWIMSFLAAFTQVNTIVVNEPVLNERSYGCKRFTIFHEMAHIKKQDYSKAALGEITVFSSYFLVKYITNNYGPDITRLLSNSISGFWNVIPALIFAGATAKYLSERAEGRADYQAAYACNCYKCVEDEIDRRAKTIGSNDVTNFTLMMQKNLLLNGGYLSTDELKLIAMELNQTDALCAYHHKNK